MARRLLRWFFLSFLFAVLPLAFVLALRWLGTGDLDIESLEASASEILFFALTISVTTEGDIVETYWRLGDADSLYYGLVLFFLFGAVWSALLYGALHFDLLMNSKLDVLSGVDMAGFRFRLLQLSASTAIGIFVLGTGAQILLARIAYPKGEKT